MNDIVIVGGGTAGWYAGAFLAFHHKDKKIILIESPDIPIIGVGEGTFPTTMHILNTIGIKPSKFLSRANGGLKLGIQYKDFSDSTFWLSIEKPDWEEWGTELIKTLSHHNKCPPLDDTDHFGCHFVASDFAKLLKDHAMSMGVEHISATVVDVTIDNDICSSITLDNQTIIESKYFVDCSGFKKLFISKTSAVFESYCNELLVDSAVVGPSQYTNKQREFTPYTRVIAKPAGWQFRIPTYERIGNGYVYSSKYATKEQAEAELRKTVGDVKVMHLKFPLGYYNKLLVGNILAVGLSGGFIEPMEATAIHLSEQTLICFNDYLNNKLSIDAVNNYLTSKIKYIKTIILAHYAFSKRTDDFWIASQQVAYNSKEIIDFFNKLKNKQYPTAEDDLDVAYPYCQWNELLKGFNRTHYYPTINTTAKNKMYLALNYFPDHLSLINQKRKQYG